MDARRLAYMVEQTKETIGKHVQQSSADALLRDWLAVPLSVLERIVEHHRLVSGLLKFRLGVLTSSLQPTEPSHKSEMSATERNFCSAVVTEELFMLLDKALAISSVRCLSGKCKKLWAAEPDLARLLSFGQPQCTADQICHQLAKFARSALELHLVEANPEIRSASSGSREDESILAYYKCSVPAVVNYIVDEYESVGMPSGVHLSRYSPTESSDTSPEASQSKQERPLLSNLQFGPVIRKQVPKLETKHRRTAGGANLTQAVAELDTHDAQSSGTQKPVANLKDRPFFPKRSDSNTAQHLQSEWARWEKKMFAAGQARNTALNSPNVLQKIQKHTLSRARSAGCLPVVDKVRRDSIFCEQILRNLQEKFTEYDSDLSAELDSRQLSPPKKVHKIQGGEFSWSAKGTTGLRKLLCQVQRESNKIAAAVSAVRLKGNYPTCRSGFGRFKDGSASPSEARGMQTQSSIHYKLDNTKRNQLNFLNFSSSKLSMSQIQGGFIKMGIGQGDCSELSNPGIYSKPGKKQSNIVSLLNSVSKTKSPNLLNSSLNRWIAKNTKNSPQPKVQAAESGLLKKVRQASTAKVPSKPLTGSSPGLVCGIFSPKESPARSRVISSIGDTLNQKGVPRLKSIEKLDPLTHASKDPSETMQRSVLLGFASGQLSRPEALKSSGRN